MNIKMILLITLSAVVLFLGIGLYQASQLTSIRITQSVTIDAGQQEVFNMVRYLENFPKWSPFLVADPGQHYEVSGNDGQIGARYHWIGSEGKEKDTGFQEIVKIDDLQYIGMQCDIQAPFEAHPSFEYHFANSPEGTKVTQDFTLKSGLVDAFFLWLFGVKKQMENTNAQGMQLLKQAVEA
ncbi:MAG: SRPBCC family protein [Bacteroidota bacterium]